MKNTIQNYILRGKLLRSYYLSRPETEVGMGPKNRIIVALAANYGNLGDVAITFAQKQFLQKLFPDYQVHEFVISETFTGMKSLKSYITEDDIITIVGGGNMGDLYDDIEFCRQFVVRNFPNNKIIIFPQTIEFSDTSEGKRALKRAARIYNAHKDLTLFVREKYSLEKYGKLFKRMTLVPDIVMSMDVPEPKENQRTGVTICFRNDKENGIADDVKEQLSSLLKKEYQVQFKDTHVGNLSDLNQLYRKLQELMTIFQQSRVVVTDRLHGMILSYVTHTPCVVLCGGSKKIAGCYEWIAQSNYIQLIDSEISKDNLEETMREVREMYMLDSSMKKQANLESGFQKLQRIIAEGKS